MSKTVEQTIADIVQQMHQANANMQNAYMAFNEIWNRERLVYTTAAAQLDLIVAMSKRDREENTPPQLPQPMP